MTLTTTDHFLILDIILSFLLLCFIIFIDKHFEENKDISEEKRRKEKKISERFHCLASSRINRLFYVTYYIV